jgi:nicotinamide-nucleotide amidase
MKNNFTISQRNAIVENHLWCVNAVMKQNRALIRARAAQTALELALRLAQGKTPTGTQVLTESAQHDPAALTALDETLRAE